jgi:Rps23 Pro-64 3,4-dihydroxylase Tpa1-like proline 4-hydroxylase
MHDFRNPALDTATIRAELRTNGIVQIANYLPEGTADHLHACLERQVPWDLAYSERGQGRQLAAAELATLSPAQIRAKVDSAFDQNQPGFRFVYNTFRIIDAWRSGAVREHALLAFANALHEPAHLQYLRELTGCAAIARTDVIAARYLPGHFLTPHDDAHSGEGREVTWILNLTRAWQPEWGGLLHLMDGGQERITHTLVPRFNTMVLFRPPLWHFVSQVANFARQPRYTLTGWMLST